MEWGRGGSTPSYSNRRLELPLGARITNPFHLQHHSPERNDSAAEGEQAARAESRVLVGNVMPRQVMRGIVRVESDSRAIVPFS